MGRKKLELKQIEDKNTRTVTFSKRKAGLTKKVRQLSLMCDVDIALIIFSSNGKLYEYCSGGTESMEDMISRYEQHCLEVQGRPYTAKDTGGSRRFQTCKELLESVERLDEGPSEGPSVKEMVDLEVDLTTALFQTRSRKMQLMMERLSSLQEQEKDLSEENEQLEQQMASAGNREKDDREDGPNPSNLLHSLSSRTSSCSSSCLSVYK